MVAVREHQYAAGKISISNPQIESKRLSKLIAAKNLFSRLPL